MGLLRTELEKLCTSYFGDASPKIVDDAQIEDKDELHDEDDATEESHDGSSLKENGTADQQVNTARLDINTGSREVSTALPEVNTATPEDLVGPSPASEDSHVEDQEIELGNIPQSYAVPTTPHTRTHKDHPIEHVIGDVQSSVQTKRMKTSYSKKGFLRRTKKSFSSSSRSSMGRSNAGGTSLVQTVKGHTQEEGIDYDEVFAPVARIEAIRLFLAYASYMGFMVYQIDVKSAFLYGQIEEEVYVCQPPGFEDPDHPNKVYKVVKALLVHQAPSMMALSLDLQEELWCEFEKLMEGSLMYLTASRPDIMLHVFVCNVHGLVSPKSFPSLSKLLTENL
ncbi:putative ribonuclease H-like domain-containing protein [Tanacetum coccineum]